MKKLVEKPSLRGQDPTCEFFLAMSVGNLDGGLDDIGGEGCEGLFPTEAEAVEVLKDLNQQYPTLDGYVYRCIPIKKIWRGETRVSEVKLRSFKPKRSA